MNKYIPGNPVVMNASLDNFEFITIGLFCNDKELTKKDDEQYHCIFVRSIQNKGELKNNIIVTDNGYQLSEAKIKETFRLTINDKRKGLGKILKEFNYDIDKILEYFSIQIFSFVKNTAEKNEQEILAYNYFKDLDENLLNSRVGGKNTTAFNKRLSKSSSKKTPIRNVTTGEIFESLSEAERQYQTNHIADVLAGRREFAAGYKWEYVDRLMQTKKVPIITNKILIGKAITDKAIRCIETNEVFQTLHDANIFLNCKKSHISTVLIGDRPTSNGYHWEYADEQGISPSREHYNLCKIGFKQGIPPVLNVDENIAYPSAKFAAEQNFLKQYQITNVCQNKQKTAINGYDIVSHWKYLTKEEYVKYANEGKAEYPPYEVK